MNSTLPTPFDDGDLYDLMLGQISYGVDFYVDLFFRTRVEVPVSGTSDYVTALKIQQAGLHVVEARAFDTSGNTSSATVTVKR